MPRKWYQRTDSDWSQRHPPGSPPVGVLVLILLVVLVISHRLWMPAVARVLFVDELPTHADAIFILGGGDGSRQDRAIALYKEGLAPLVISSGEAPKLPDSQRTFAEVGADYMLARGVPAQSILLMGETTSTYDEAQASLELAKARGFSTLLVVSDHYHLGRSRLVFRHVFRGSGIRPIFVAANPNWFDANAWWTQERSLLAVFEEYEKLLFYLLRGYLF
jgi:uncharacterized SAM-binding protein YcdF (DUF218 family)